MYISRKKKGARATLFKPSFRRKRGISRFAGEHRRLSATNPEPRPTLGIVFTAPRYHLHRREEVWITRFVSTLIQCSGTCEDAHTDLPRRLGVILARILAHYTRIIVVILGAECLIRSFVFMKGEERIRYNACDWIQF